MDVKHLNKKNITVNTKTIHEWNMVLLFTNPHNLTINQWTQFEEESCIIIDDTNDTFLIGMNSCIARCNANNRETITFSEWLVWANEIDSDKIKGSLELYSFEIQEMRSGYIHTDLQAEYMKQESEMKRTIMVCGGIGKTTLLEKLDADIIFPKLNTLTLTKIPFIETPEPKFKRKNTRNNKQAIKFQNKQHNQKFKK